MQQEMPQKLGQFYGYNEVNYNQLYWGIPQSMGQIKLERIVLSEYPEIINAFTQDELEIKIFEAWMAQNRPKDPICFKQIFGHSLVGFRGKYYGIPAEVGEVRLEKIDVNDETDFIVSDALSDLVDKVIEKIFIGNANPVPLLVMNLNEYNIVCFQKQFIALPKHFGDVRLEETDLNALKGVIRSNSIRELREAVFAKKQIGLNKFLRRIVKRIGFAG